MYIPFNNNPCNRRVGDCVVRAISKVMDKSWEDTYMALAFQGIMLCDMPTANHVWGSYLSENGFKREIVENSCPDCYSVAQFCIDNPTGTYVLATGTHVIAVENGNYYDSWDSGDEVPIYAWRKE